MVAAGLLKEMWRSLSGADGGTERVEFSGEGVVPSAFAATDFAAASVAVAGLAVARLLEAAGTANPGVAVDRTLASAWFATSLRPQGWTLPPVWDPVAGAYEAADGWIRLHTNVPRHREAALRVIGCAPDRESVAAAVRRRDAAALEEAVVAEGGCAAAMRSLDEWAGHPQGAAVAAEPLVDTTATGAGPDGGWRPRPERPLAGVRVLDLTRVLAGPVATRFLAGYGADVLRVDPPDWDEELVAAEVTLGKRCARLDAKSRGGREQLRELLADADVLVHGYRPGALDELGLGPEERDAIRPGLVDICLDAYGWTGPWRSRRGFDSLVQMSTGIADAGRIWAGSEAPRPLPFQALDQATGYLMAAAAVRGLTVRLADGHGLRARCSLARTARLLVDAGEGPADRPAVERAAAPTAEGIETTVWGPAKRVAAPLRVTGAPLEWTSPAVALGSGSAHWQTS